MEFKVGDRVRIKSWEQMEKEFGKVPCGSIDCMPHFIEDMKYLCGKTATIDEICGCDIELKAWSGDSGKIHWSFSTDMIELVDTSNFTKSDLQNGDIVTDREGDKSVYFNEFLYGNAADLYFLTNDLKHKHGIDNYDIVKVERPIKSETVFERKDEPKVREMTVEEISKELGYEVKVVK